MKKLFFLASICIVNFCIVFSSFADTIFIDMNEFYYDDTVSINPTGSNAHITESPDFGSALLSNDPYMGDPGITISDDLLYVSFDYQFIITDNNSDSFYAKLFYGDSGDIINDFECVITDEGTVSWNLTNLNPMESLLGIEFQLNSNDSLFDSSLNISNLFIETTTPSPAPVPEPSTMVLLSMGLIGMAKLRRGFHTEN